ncbi:uncharacterized protein [Diadema antillarum]|uniref:uncharacterized protein isoform X1 n=1 Tax=Diadema antillarum TaxID=105358 RepID=UPI003A8B859A
MSMECHQIDSSGFLTLQKHSLSVNLFSTPPSDLLKDPNMMQGLSFFAEDTESAELVSVADEVSGVAEDLVDLGYDTNSEIASPMSAKSLWGDASTPSSSVGSCTEEDLFPDFEEETRTSLISILDDDKEWNKSLSGPPMSNQSGEGSTQDQSPRSPMVGQVPNATTTSHVDFTSALRDRNLLQPSSPVTEGTTTLLQTAKPSRKRAAASTSTCGLAPGKRPRKQQYPSLLQALPDKLNGAALRINIQPEKHHRARYRTEGSRGSVKDESGDCYPKLQLEGVNQPVMLQVFVGIDQGKIRPHGYYQACKVTGRNTTPCEENDIDGTTVLEVPWEPSDGKMELSVDCIGILKLRNADVEQRIGPIRSKRKSTCVRLVFRVYVPSNDGFFTLQALSRPITCTQPLGHPEIVKKSLTQCSVAGGEELFIIGKNFTSKATTEVKLRQLDDNGKVTWEGDCEIDKALFQNTHIVCKIPPYANQKVTVPVRVYLVVVGKPNHCSELEAHPIDYIPKPDSVAIQSPPVATGAKNQGNVNAAAPSSSPAVLSPAQAPMVLSLSPVVKPEQSPPLPAQISSNAASTQDEFSLALQMLACAYLKNRDMYNNLLMQTQAQDSSAMLDDSLQGQVPEKGKVGDGQRQRPDCAVKTVYQVQAEGLPGDKTAESDCPDLLKTEPGLTTIDPELADIYDLVLPDITDIHALDDVLDVLNNN